MSVLSQYLSIISGHVQLLSLPWSMVSTVKWRGTSQHLAGCTLRLSHSPLWLLSLQIKNLSYWHIWIDNVLATRRHPTWRSYFDVSFPEKLPKIVATRGEIFSLKLTKYLLAAGLRPDPLGELKRSPRPPSRNKGGLLLRGGEGRGGEEERRGRGRGLRLKPPKNKNPGYVPDCCNCNSCVMWL